MASAPHPPGPAESDRKANGRRGPRLEDSLILGGLAGIFSVTLATLAMAVAGALIALLVSLVF